MKIDPRILSEAAKLFDLQISELRPLGGQEGMALEFQRADSQYILKITPKSKEDPTEVKQLEEKLEFISYLAENGVQVAKPIPAPTGEWVKTFEDDDHIYLLNTLTKAEGKHIDLYNPADGTPQFFRAWGRVTGQMHAAAKNYPLWQKNPADGSHPSAINDWRGEHKFFSGWCQFDDVRTKWIELGEKIAQLPQTREGFGLIHNDLHPWNMLVNLQGEITVIDFDVCAHHFFVKDIAIALFFANWSGNPGKGRSKNEYLTIFFQNFMGGYAAENVLASFWIEQLPLFTKHHQILLHTVFTDEWKPYNKWQSATLKKWKHQIVNDIPVVRLQF